jgi:hypothetical protein
MGSNDLDQMQIADDQFIAAGGILGGRHGLFFSSPGERQL